MQDSQPDASAPRRLRYAFETVVWGRTLYDLNLVLTGLAACGYEGVEFAQPPSEILMRDVNAPGGRRPVRDIAELLGRLRAHGLELVSLAGGPLADRVAFCGDFRPPYLYVEEYDDDARAALRLEPPFILGLHPHWFMKVQRAGQVRERIRRCSDDFPGQNCLKFLPDTAHLTIVDDGSVVEAIRVSQHQLAAVHIKDWTPSYGRYSHRYAQGFVSLGKGIVENRATLAMLDEIGWEGWIVVEQDTADDTPLESAWQCAEWLAKERRLQIKDEAWLATHAHSVALQDNGEGAAVGTAQAGLLRWMLPAVTRGPAGFYTAVIEGLLKQGGLDGAVLYNFNPTGKELYLLSAAGQGTEDCPHIIPAAASMLKGVIEGGQCSCFDLDALPDFSGHDPREQAFLTSVPGRRLDAVPIFNASNAHQLHYVLCLLPSQGGSVTSIAGMAPLARQIARMADCMADDICSSAAGYTSYYCGGATKREEFVARLWDWLCRKFDCEGTTILLVDETGTRMEVARTSGIKWSPGLKLHEQCYRKNQGLTGYVWASRQMLLTSDAKNFRQLEAAGITADARSCEDRASLNRDECLIAPLVRLGGEVIGAIRLLNKKAKPGSRAATMFTDDDAAVVDAIIQAAMPHLEMLTLQERQLKTIARMVHEFQNPLAAIRGQAQWIEMELKAKTPPVELSEDYLGDIDDWCQLMGRLAQNARVFSGKPGANKPVVEKVQFRADIVVPAVVQARRLLKDRGFSREAISYGDFYFIPSLWLDKFQFQQVIFNLLANAIKFADPKALKVQISGYQEGSNFVVLFDDYGPGVEDGLEEMIFLPNFRSERAMRRDVAGQGIGLYVVRSIIEAHGGRISLAKHYRPTQFKIELPESLRHTPPPGSGRPIQNR